MQASPIRTTSVLRNRSWLALAPVAALAFGLAYWGFGQIDNGTLTTFERIEKSAQLIKGGGSYSFPKDPLALVLAQWLVPLVAVLTAAKLFLSSLRRDLRVVFAKRARDHVIVCGVGRTGRRIVEILRARGDRVLAIDLDAESADARAVENLGAPTIAGDAKTAAMLQLAGVRRARMLVACTGNDTVNLEIALSAVEAAGSGFRFGGRLAVVPEMRADWLFERFVGRAGASLGSEAAEVRILNTAEAAGRLLCAAPALAGLTTLRPERTDLAILGFGDVGRAVAAQAVRTFALPGRRMRLHVFDARGEAIVTAFAALHPGIDEVADLAAAEVTVAAAKPESWDAIRAGMTAEGLATARLAAFVVCLPDDGASLYAATRARETLDALDARSVPVFVRVAGRRKLAEVIARTDAAPWLGQRFVPFGDLADLLAAGVGDEVGDVLARACHEAYLDTLPGPSDAPSARPWASLPELFKRSNRLFADHLEVKLRAAGLRACPAPEPRPFDLTPADLEALSAAEHWRWLVERRLAGWRHGAVRDDGARLHPLIRPWDDLAEASREGVRSTVARIPAILARVGREIRRELLAGPDGAEAALDGFDPAGTEHLVLTLDPADAPARDLALRALEVPNVTLRLAPRGPSGALGLEPGEVARLHARTDGVIETVPDPAAPSPEGPRALEAAAS